MFSLHFVREPWDISILENNSTLIKGVHDIGAPQYIRQILTDIKIEINSNTIIVGDFTTHTHQWTDHQNRKLMSKQSLK